MSKLLLLLSYLAVFLYSLYFWERPIFDPDLGWHLAGGKWISGQIALAWEQNQLSSAMLIPPFDFINSRQEYWHDYHWLIQIVMYQIYKHYSYLELICFYSVIFSLTCLIIFKIALRIARERKLSIIYPLIGTLAASYLLKDVSSVRPQLISFLFIAITANLLLQPARKFEGLILFFLAVILVNIHVYWIFIPFLYFCYRIIPNLLKKKPKEIIANNLFTLLLILLAGFISPYGIFSPSQSFADYFRNYYLIIEYLQTDVYLKKLITEFLGAFRAWSPTTFICIAYLICLARFLNKEEIFRNLGLHFAGAISFYLVLESVKFSSIFAILALVSWISIIPKVNFLSNQKLFIPILLALNLSLTVGVISRLQSKEKIALDIELFTPMVACSKLATLNLPPKKYQVLTEFTHGGWCYWAIFSQGVNNFQVTTDGRTQGVPIEDYKKSTQIYTVKEGWNKTIIDWNPDFILASRETSLAHVMPFFKTEWSNLTIDRSFAMYINNKLLPSNTE